MVEISTTYIRNTSYPALNPNLNLALALTPSEVWERVTARPIRVELWKLLRYCRLACLSGNETIPLQPSLASQALHHPPTYTHPPTRAHTHTNTHLYCRACTLKSELHTIPTIPWTQTLSEVSKPLVLKLEWLDFSFFRTGSLSSEHAVNRICDFLIAMWSSHDMLASLARPQTLISSGYETSRVATCNCKEVRRWRKARGERSWASQRSGPRGSRRR